MYGNPSSLHSFGRNAKKAIENSRLSIASLIGAMPEEIYFTSSGTESINWAIRTAIKIKKNMGNHIITSAIEHPSVLKTLKQFEKIGYEITVLGVDENGQISLNELRSSIRKDTILITTMFANNEIGTIFPIAEISDIAKKNNILFHTDAVQAIGHVPINVNDIQIDMLSFSGHKFGGIKGTGALYVKNNLNLPAFLHGGGQEKGKRSGTENVFGIVNLSEALKESIYKIDTIKDLTQKLIDGVLKIPCSKITGSLTNRLPGIASFVFNGIEGESLVLMLDQYGVCASSGSACSSGSLNPSHVLKAIGLSDEEAYGALRLSLGYDNTEEEVDFVLEILPEIIHRLRNMSPMR